MSKRGLVLHGNTGGTQTDYSGETGAILHLVLVAAGLLASGATLPCGSRI
jgi:hypothetical protein